MSNRLISKCKRCLEMAEHGVRSTGKPNSYCIRCQREYSREHYQANKDVHIKRQVENGKRRRQELRSFLDELKCVPCMDCGVRYPPFVMDFDHQADKEFSISNALRLGVSKARLLAEIAKCEVVCANCHRIRTHA